MVDVLNEKAYACRYRDLDATARWAQRAYKVSGAYSAGRAEALNHLAFVQMAAMDYKQAQSTLDKVEQTTDNQVELFIADVQMMRLCQRRSRNKDFYVYKDKAERRRRRIKEESALLSPHQIRRMIYANTEYDIVTSTYFYYVGLPKPSMKALDDIDPNGSINQDTTQTLSYLYNIGSGGYITHEDRIQTAIDEFDYLVRCYILSAQGNYPYWQAQALQAMAEHLLDRHLRSAILQHFSTELKYINIDNMPDSLLAGYFSQRALQVFKDYKDVYQVAGAYRTLAQCYWDIGDYRSALVCLNAALSENRAIEQAPDLVASIREQLSLAYSAIDDKPKSDYNRNIYLDLQEQTRQDRMLEARASQLDNALQQLNIMMGVVLASFVLVIILLVVFFRMRRKGNDKFSLETMLEPLRLWQKEQLVVEENKAEARENVEEERRMTALHLAQNRRRNIEQRAKVALIASVQPLIDRIVNELRLLKTRQEDEAVRSRRLQYVGELTHTIDQYNNTLTRWVEMRQGEIRLRIETFPLNDLFRLVSKSRMGFQLKGVTLEVLATNAMVKADKTLTLFMINTIADNARKFTPRGGTVSLSAVEEPNYIEISVQDDGVGMTEEQQANLFNRTYTGGHGFGLKNCNGIIEKYKKLSHIFSVCAIGVESRVGKGSRIYFRLPRSITRLLLGLALFTGSIFHSGVSYAASPSIRHTAQPLPSRPVARNRAAAFADSAYYSNISGQFARTLAFADSCKRYLLPTDTATMLDISNETAVAALALHRWELYHRANSRYTSLFRLVSADNSLPQYVRQMQRSQTNKSIAVAVLVILMLLVFPAYYLLYYRNLLGFRYCIDRIATINHVLMSGKSDEEKLREIIPLTNLSDYHLTEVRQKEMAQVTSNIVEALRIAIRNNNKYEADLEMAVDELNRTKLEAERLYVANNVLDNCLSTLKHETMYYPSRLTNMLEEEPIQVNNMLELAEYYRQLYSILTEQAADQLPLLRNDDFVVKELCAIMRQINDGEMPNHSLSEHGTDYVRMDYLMHRVPAEDLSEAHIFTLDTPDFRYLLCRQIVRELGEMYNRRACGLYAKIDDAHRLHIIMTLPQRVYHKITT